MSKVGIISDTHGLLRREVLTALQGCELIVHAGDVGAPEVLDGLRTIAPVMAVRGNVDGGAWANDLPLRQTVAAGEARLYVLHNLDDLRADPVSEGWQAVIFGHSHRPHLERRDGVLFLNPGAAGPRRFSLPVSVALLETEGEAIEARLLTLDI